MMSKVRISPRLIAVGASCAAIGAGVGTVANAGAWSGSGHARARLAHRGAAHRGAFRGAGAKRLGRIVHGSFVVATKNGFATFTLDRGFVQSVSGQQLTLREGTPSATYQTVTLTIPTNAIVRDDGKSASLSDLSAGQRASVLQGPNKTFVLARTVKGS
jgi:hypothetical protein